MKKKSRVTPTPEKAKEHEVSHAKVGNEITYEVAVDTIQKTANEQTVTNAYEETMTTMQTRANEGTYAHLPQKAKRIRKAKWTRGQIERM